MAYNIAPAKQDLLVSGTNIKTINSNSILGSGNLTISGLPSSVNPTDADKVVAVDSSGVASWQYAGLGSGSFGTDNIILGRAKPTGFAGYTVDNIIINSSSTAPLSVFSGAYNILIGSAGKGQTFQNDNIIIGQLPNTVGNAAASVSIGNALYIANSNYAVTIGRAATAYQEAVTVGYSSYSGNTGNVAIGSSAIAFGADSISIGRLAAMGSGASNIVIGKSSGKYPSTGADNTIVGTASFIAVTSGSSNTIIGAASATALTTGTGNTVIGKGAGSALTTGNYNTFVGNDAGSQQTTASNSVVVGQSNTIGTTAGFYYVLGNNNTCSGVGCISIGYAANAGTGRYNLTAGISSGSTTNTGEFNIFIGTNCAYGGPSNANSNVCIGYDAARWLSTGNENLILGHGAGHSISSGTYNVALGYYAGSNIGSRTETVSLGRNAGGSNTGSYSVFIGSYSGQNASAGNEFYLGNQNYANNTDEKAKSLMYGQFNATTTSQTLTINATTTSTYGLVGNNNGGDYDSYIKGLADDNLLYVDAGNDRVGVGTNVPDTKLHVKQESAATNTVTNVLRVDSQSSGTPASGIGVGIEMAAETAAGNTEVGVVLEAVTTDVTSTSEDFDFVVKNMAAGATAAETLRVTSTGNTKVSNGDLILNTEGNGLKIKTGADATAGLATISNGNSSVTVNTNKCSATSIILVTNQTSTAYVAVTTKTSGSFKIEHANAVGADQECAWFIINPA